MNLKTKSTSATKTDNRIINSRKHTKRILVSVLMVLKNAETYYLLNIDRIFGIFGIFMLLPQNTARDFIPDISRLSLKYKTKNIIHDLISKRSSTSGKLV